MAKPVVLLYEQIHEDALVILEEKAEIRWAKSLIELGTGAYCRQQLSS